MEDLTLNQKKILWFLFKKKQVVNGSSLIGKFKLLYIDLEKLVLLDFVEQRPLSENIYTSSYLITDKGTIYIENHLVKIFATFLTLLVSIATLIVSIISLSKL